MKLNRTLMLLHLTWCNVIFIFNLGPEAGNSDAVFEIRMGQTADFGYVRALGQRQHSVPLL